MAVTGNDWYDDCVLAAVFECDDATVVFTPLKSGSLVGRQFYVKPWSPMVRGSDPERMWWHIGLMGDLREECGGVR